MLREESLAQAGVLLYSKSGPDLLSAPSDTKLPKREYSFKSLTKKQRERLLILGEAWEEVPPPPPPKEEAREDKSTILMLRGEPPK
jgi:hypothetical protein